MIRRASSFVIALFTVACASSRRGAGPVAPVPASQPSTATAAPAATTQAPVAQQASPSNPTETKPAADSARLSSTDVNKRMTDLFGGGDSAKMTKPSPDSTVAAPVWDIEVRAYESTSRVERYLRMFTGPAKDRIESRLERGTRYEPMIRAKFRDGGLPEDLYYLAL